MTNQEALLIVSTYCESQSIAVDNSRCNLTELDATFFNALAIQDLMMKIKSTDRY